MASTFRGSLRGYKRIYMIEMLVREESGKRKEKYVNISLQLFYSSWKKAYSEVNQSVWLFHSHDTHYS